MEERGELFGEVKISIFENNLFSIKNTFEYPSHELFFLLYMVDRILSEINDIKRKQNIAALVSRYISNSNNGRIELMNHFGNYNMIIPSNHDIVFEADHELYVKQKVGGEHIYVWSEYVNSDIDFDGKIGNATMLYVIDFMNRLDKQEQEICANAYNAMLKIYLESQFPVLKTITSAPSRIVNEMLKS